MAIEAYVDENSSLSLPPIYSEQERLAADDMVQKFHAELMQIARSRRRRAQMSDTMLTLDLLHEAYLKLCNSENFRSPSHFLAVASLAIRQVVIDHARRKLASKRLAVDEVDLTEFGETPEQLVAIGDLLEKLGKKNPMWLRVVDARYFAGQTEAEAAAVLGRSERSIRRDWQDARAWIASQLL